MLSCSIICFTPSIKFNVETIIKLGHDRNPAEFEALQIGFVMGWPTHLQCSFLGAVNC